MSKALGIFHSENCRGIHVNFMIASPNRYNPRHLLQLANAFAPYADRFPLFLSADEIKGIKGLGHFQSQESGKASLIAASSTCCTEWMHLHVPGSVSRIAYLAATVYCVPCVHQSGTPEAFLHSCALPRCTFEPFPSVCRHLSCQSHFCALPDCCKPLPCLNRRFCYAMHWVM